jgi:hypothetical protein
VWSKEASKSGTPMAWQQDDEVPSLAPRGRRVMLIAAVAVPLVAIGVFVMMRKNTKPAHEVTPDAAIEMAVDAATPADAPAIDAAMVKPDAAAPKPMTGSDAPPSPSPSPSVKPPVVKGGPKPPITKKPPLIKKRR